MKTDLFQSCGHCWVFQICWHIECNTFTASPFRIWNSSTGIPLPPLALFVVMPLRPTWLHVPGCLVLGEWSHHRDHLDHENPFGSFSVYSCHLFLISSASVRSIPFLSFIEPIFAWNAPLVSLIFLKRSLSPSIVFLYFFALITEEGFLISPCYSLELSTYIQYYVYFNSNPHLSLPGQALLISLLLHVHHYATDDLTQSHGFKYQLMVTSSSL